jgi:hypothetical protein
MASRVRRELIDDLMEAYVSWREECAALVQAYERWASVPPTERDLAFAAYTAALDREQQATAVYSNRIERVEREIEWKQRNPLRQLWGRRKHTSQPQVEAAR